MSNMRVELGDKVKDIACGIVGVVTSRTEYINGCIQFMVETNTGPEGKDSRDIAFDEGRLKVLVKRFIQKQLEPVAKKKVEKKDAPGGPSKERTGNIKR